MQPTRASSALGLRSLARVLPCLAAAALLASTVHGHENTALWLSESSVDRGLYLDVRHPRVIRKAAPFEVSLVISNLGRAGEVVVTEVRYRLPGALDVVRHGRRHRLISRRLDYQRYQSVRRQLQEAESRHDAGAARRLLAESRSRLARIATATFRDRQVVPAGEVPDVGATLEIPVEVDVLEDGVSRTLERRIRIPVQPPLPDGVDGSWFSGDQHLHTAYSIDAFLLEGTTALLASYAETAQAAGLDWIIVTDHTNVDFLGWYRPWMFTFSEALARAFREDRDYLVLQGQEMGVGSNGRFGESAHLLVYPYLASSTGFLKNPCHGLVGNHVNCEAEQVILDRVNDNGGIGFIAHPFFSFPLSYAEWDRDSDATGWAGLEIFNSSAGVLKPTDEKSVAWWHQLLEEIEPPRDGQLALRPDYPTRFPVGLGNSDAHRPNEIGSTFSYARIPAGSLGEGRLPREDVMDALVSGRIVASNGPLLHGEINGSGIGEVAVLPAGENELTVTLETTSEFGTAGDYTIRVLVNGSERAVVPPAPGPSFHRTVVLGDLLAPPDRFVTLRAECASCSEDGLVFHAIANPIWLEFPTTDSGR